MFRASLIVSLLCGPTLAQLAITELQLDPAGPNGAAQIVEITNVDTMPFTSPGDWTLCVRPLYPPLPQITIAPGASVRVHIGAVGTDTATDWFVPGIPVLPLDGEIAIYSTTFLFNDPTQMISFASWGIGEQNPFMSRMVEATTAGLWPSPTVHITLPPEGASTAAYLGSGTGPQSWYIDTTPTLGAPNNPASFETFGTGCTGGGGVPSLDVSTPGALPWLGTSLPMTVSNLDTGATAGFLVLSFTETPPQNLAALGLGATCESYLTADTLLLALASAGTLQYSLTLPLNASLEGVQLIAQAVATDPSVASPVQFTVSNAARIRTGLQ